MITKLQENDLDRIMALVGKNPAINLFIIGDVENFGFGQDFMELWGESDSPEGPLTAVMLRYFGSYLPYAEGAFDADGFAELIRRNTAAEMISGSSEVVQAFRGKVGIRNEKNMHFAQVSEMNDEIRSAVSTPVKIKRAAVEDVEAICSLMDIIEEFESSPEDSRRSYRKTLESGTGRTYFAEQDGRVIAAASTTAENSMSAMIVGVATHPEYRGKGLATRVVAQLCTEIIAEGKSLCLFYDNPQAGVIYKKLGFSDIGSWTMTYLHK
ncbi:GNAT family N-acetyltransferase [Paenibacillus sp. PK3_47]|uniref:GNAT family N-acetyltransferase n=1 Tax=Paenibacillus sp. PK3_47 TaxID=2072642 RepID=UPI00201D70B1|nr:GNAT family N-acetyltransferase [Paenibacillus sp. PK3_47]UQZ37188.1 GNAT family N-acetyltransferase [Paenibacillus sp. PK3_47]